MGPPLSRPPEVPRETYFRPITSFVLAAVDVGNGMQMKPGVFVRSGHDYRIDLREALQKTFALPATDEQAARIEAALRHREQDWAERRLVARTGEIALRNLSRTINSSGTAIISQGAGGQRSENFQSASADDDAGQSAQRGALPQRVFVGVAGVDHRDHDFAGSALLRPSDRLRNRVLIGLREDSLDGHEWVRATLPECYRR